MGVPEKASKSLVWRKNWAPPWCFAPVKYFYPMPLPCPEKASRPSWGFCTWPTPPQHPPHSWVYAHGASRIIALQCG